MRHAGLTLKVLYTRLMDRFGPQGWWPVSRRASSPSQARLEIVLGAVLTQNTAWSNVRKALDAMYDAGLVDLAKLQQVSEATLAEVIRPSGTYRVKARRLKALIRAIQEEHGDSLERLLNLPLDDARAALLRISGIGPETADAILLYAGSHATFVVDAYTRRILRRHGLTAGSETSDALRRKFHDAVRPDLPVYREYHALLVELGKRHCGATARCDGCPLETFPHDASL